MVLEDRSLYSLEDRTYGARRSFASAALEDRLLALHSKIVSLALHSKNFKALRADLQAAGDLQGLCPIFKPQAIYRLKADL